MDIQTPWSSESSLSGPNVVGDELRPRPPCPPSQRKISHSPEQTPPKLGGSPHSQPFFQPSYSNQAKLARMSETLRIGVSAFAITRSRS
jgi:hypothetical protein